MIHLSFSWSPSVYMWKNFSQIGQKDYKKRFGLWVSENQDFFKTIINSFFGSLSTKITTCKLSTHFLEVDKILKRNSLIFYMSCTLFLVCPHMVIDFFQSTKVNKLKKHFQFLEVQFKSLYALVLKSFWSI